MLGFIKMWCLFSHQKTNFQIGMLKLSMKIGISSESSYLPSNFAQKVDIIKKFQFRCNRKTIKKFFTIPHGERRHFQFDILLFRKISYPQLSAHYPEIYPAHQKSTCSVWYHHQLYIAGILISSQACTLLRITNFQLLPSIFHTKCVCFT